MNKLISTQKLLIASAMLLAGQCYVNGQVVYHGNSSWADKSEYFPIVEENFQDWNTPAADGTGIKLESVLSCANGGAARGDVNNYASWTVYRPINAKQNVTGNFAFYLDFCQVQPTCDTQSGTYNTDGSIPVGTGDSKGASWNNVSVGCVSIYDNFNTIRPATSGATGDGVGSITTSKITKLERIQYTTSSYGQKRGFHLEIGFDAGDGTIAWDTVRYIAGSTFTNFSPAAEKAALLASGATPTSFAESGRGWVFEEVFDPETYQNCYLRIRPTLINRQIVRLHDFKIYGQMAQADVVSAVKNTFASEFKLYGSKGLYSLSEEADVTVMNVSGCIVKSVSDTQSLDLTTLPSGIYIVKAVSVNGQVVAKTIAF